MNHADISKLDVQTIFWDRSAYLGDVIRKQRLRALEKIGSLDGDDLVLTQGRSGYLRDQWLDRRETTADVIESLGMIACISAILLLVLNLGPNFIELINQWDEMAGFSRFAFYAANFGLLAVTALSMFWIGERLFPRLLRGHGRHLSKDVKAAAGTLLAVTQDGVCIVKHDADNVNVPFDQIADVVAVEDPNQGVVYDLVVVYLMGHDDIVLARIPGIDRKEADRFRDRVLGVKRAKTDG